MIQLFVNQNALSTTYVGNEAFTAESADPFVPNAITVPVDAYYAIENTIPTFNANMTGISDSEPYFMIDFQNSNTIAWNTDC